MLFYVMCLRESNVNTRSAFTKHNRYSYEHMLSAGSRMVMLDLPCDDTSSNKTFCEKTK